MYSSVTQQTISYIEEQLTSELLLDDFTSVVGYSKFHLSRIFKAETGMTINEYIRVRRLATAAMYLLYSAEPILEIAFMLRFRSQEAFTRSFKEQYAMPPGKYRKMMQALCGTEDGKMEKQTEVKGWLLSGSHPHHYSFGVDEKVFHTGTKSGVLYSTENARLDGFGTMMQSFLADDFKGKRIKLSCYLKTEEVEKCGAWCRVDNAAGDTLQFDNMDNRSITGSTDWNYYSIVLDVPMDSASIHFGVLLVGSGKVWADGFKFEEVDEKVPTTNMMAIESLPMQPVNLTFND